MLAVFADKLAESRHARGYSQKESAEALGISQALLSHYEKGIREPGLDFVVRAARYYGVTTDYLLGFDATCCPSPAEKGRVSGFTLRVERQFKDTMDLVLSGLNWINDPELTAYALTYLSEAAYEIFRHLCRMFEDYAPEDFWLSDQSFDSGALVSDMTWLRTQFILAACKYVDKNGFFPSKELEAQERLSTTRNCSVQELMHMVGSRIAKQEGSYFPPAEGRFQNGE